VEASEELVGVVRKRVSLEREEIRSYSISSGADCQEYRQAAD
jgi:hypothetical protein